MRYTWTCFCLGATCRAFQPRCIMTCALSSNIRFTIITIWKKANKAKGFVSWLYAKAVGSEPSIMDIQHLKPYHVTCMAITLVGTWNPDRLWKNICLYDAFGSPVDVVPNSISDLEESSEHLVWACSHRRDSMIITTQPEELSAPIQSVLTFLLSRPDDNSRHSSLMRDENRDTTTCCW